MIKNLTNKINLTQNGLRIGAWLRTSILSCAIVGSLTAANTYLVHNLVSDLPGTADHTDKNLVNPWGNGFSATSPFWVGDNRTGLSTLYDGYGTPTALVVSIPAAAGGTAPGPVTGVLQNPNVNGWFVATGKQSQFVFCTEDGTISGWNSTVDATHAKILIDNSKTGAVYKGCAFGGTPAASLLFAANFNSGNIDVFDATLKPINNPGAFANAVVPPGFAPFNIQNIGGLLYVTYAKQDSAKKNDVFGPGNGYVTVYDTLGNVRSYFAAQGPLNSPWGVALAPASFGDFAGAILVGNFGDGKINAFNATTGALMGTLNDLTGAPISIQGLWSLNFGNNSKDPNTLYFTAGIGGGPNKDPIQSHGLLGSIQAAPVFATAQVQNAGSFSTNLAPNTWGAIIKGGALSPTTRSWQTADFVGGALPTSLDKVGVTINGEGAFISFISATQINFLIPADIVPGPAQVVVTNNGLKSATVNATIAATAPTFFTLGATNAAGLQYIAATHADGSLGGPPNLVTGLTSTPFKVGETIVLYGTGFGATNPPIPNGKLITAPAPLTVIPTISIGGVPAQVVFAGLTGAGLYQFNVIVPSGLPPGTGTNLDEKVVVSLAGVPAQSTAAISVVNPGP